MNRVSAVTRREDDGLLAFLNSLAEGDRQHLPASGPASREPKETPTTRAGLSLLAGPPFVLDLGTTLAGRVTLSGRTVLYVDGANAFDPYILSALARDAGQSPRAVMQRLHLTRAFTCHQLETLIVERLPSAIARYCPGLVVISGWSHLFHDENVPAREAFRLLQNTARRVRSLAEAGQPILATHSEEPVTQRLQPLGEILTRAAAKYHVAAMVYASRVTPLEAILMSILVEYQKAVAQLKGRIRELEAAVLPSLALTPPDPAA